METAGHGKAWEVCHKLESKGPRMTAIDSKQALKGIIAVIQFVPEEEQGETNKIIECLGINTKLLLQVLSSQNE
jgi:hypothetical protein